MTDKTAILPEWKEKMMVQFVDEKAAWRTAGAPRRLIPEELQTWMNETYARHSVCELPRPAADDDTADLLGLLRLHAKREGKTLRFQFFERDGVTHLRFKMRDKRPYHRSALPREKR